MSYPKRRKPAALAACLERDMGRPDTITMSLRELDRCKVIEAVVSRVAWSQELTGFRPALVSRC